MASVSSITRQIAALELSSKQNAARPPSTQHQKKPSQTNVSKMLTKFAAPNPFPSSTSIHKTASSASLAAVKQTSRPLSPPKPQAQPTIDIGHYDGGFEIDNESRGERVFGEAAEELALDSSVLR
ncbi:hypothetical protein A0H81_08532 [Grifola frondosa]|uniref:Uncharacterized protein n=1 Tax=Grifola frondosa TaxID=5627 RepID=A0A1C7M517_GRIFR|nr:hypothetical protein A0H81_08532 [Grifola frondosa]